MAKERAHKWISGAVEHKGALHRALGVPEGEKIPAKKMAEAAKSTDPHMEKMVNLAHTLKGMSHKRSAKRYAEAKGVRRG